MSEETRLDRSLRWFKNNPVFSVLLLLVVVIVGASQLVGALSNLISAGKELRSTTTTAPVTDERADVAIVAAYGGKGSGPGYFNGARILTIDNDRELVVAETGGRGRIQQLSLTGAPTAQWFLGADPMQDYSVSGLIDDHQGNVYVAHANALVKRDLATGRPLGETNFKTCEPWINAVGLQSSGPIAICESNLALLRNGAPDKATLIQLPDKRTFALDLASRLAVDGDDNIYMLDMSNCYVYKLSPDGTFVNRFGGDGMGQGLMHTPSAIAVDGMDDVYVADINGIQVFTSDGRFVRTLTMPRIDTPYPIREMAFSRNHDLYAIYDDKLRVLRLPPEKQN